MFDPPPDEHTETALRNFAERDKRLGALEAKAVELSAVIGAATGQLLEVIAGFDDAYSGGDVSPSGNLETRDWVAWACGTDKRSASRLLRLAHRLKELPQTASALRAGTVTLDKVDALSRIASADNEEVLLEWAGVATAEQLRSLAAGYLRSSKAAEDAFARRAARSVTYHYDDFGDLNLRARLPGEQGAVVTKALEVAAEELRADAGGGSEAGRPEAHAADALVAVADSFLATGAATRPNTERYQVMISTERDPVTGELFDARLPKDIPLPIESALRLTCDCSVVEMATLNGEPFDMGRKSRRPNTSLRRALAKRDGCCRFPGCSRKAYLDAHHIRHWIKGGPTALDNLVLLCSHHHRLVHEGRYDVKMGAGGIITFLRPDGSVIPDRPPTCEMTRAEIDAAADLLYATPAEPHWVDPLDLDLAVTVLHQLERRAPEPTCTGSGEP
ncbi:MAG TPA: DUF222 domain-containing protein [Actinomycetota bacterium]|nr:DUF222 domain-containing protein [Actinomycetota bacterium]